MRVETRTSPQSPDGGNCRWDTWRLLSLNQVGTTRFGELYEKMDVGDERHKGGGSRTCIYIDYREGRER